MIKIDDEIMRHAVLELARLDREIDAAIYRLIDHRIATGEYKPEEREERFAWAKRGCARIEAKMDGRKDLN